MISLLHGTVPLWFQNRRGWLASDSPQQFSAYVGYVVTRLGDLCDLWVTINEPIVLIGEGYLEGIAPPQIASPESSILAAWNMIRAHRMATVRMTLLQRFTSSFQTGHLPGLPCTATSKWTDSSDNF
jgi:beta-glucosidase